MAAVLRHLRAHLVDGECVVFTCPVCGSAGSVPLWTRRGTVALNTLAACVFSLWLQLVLDLLIWVVSQILIKVCFKGISRD